MKKGRLDMKKYLALLLALVMSLSLFACGKKEGDDNKDKTEYKVAMITDYGDITDQSFNQTTYEACKAFAEKNKIEFKYYKPAGDNTADRVGLIVKIKEAIPYIEDADLKNTAADIVSKLVGMTDKEFTDLEV